MSSKSKSNGQTSAGGDADSETANVSPEQLKTFTDNVRQRIQHLDKQRDLNLSPKWPEEGFFRNKDSSLKKNTAFVKKLKTLTESQRDALLKDFEGLNLTKYVGEVADSLAEAKIKMADVSLAVELSQRMHRRYGDFSPALLNAFKKQFPKKKDDKIANAAKLRVDLRVFTDLLILAVLPEKEALSTLGATLVYLVNTDKTAHNNATLLTTFLKYCGEEFAGLAPRSYRLAAEKSGQSIPVCTVMSAEHRQKIITLFNGYYETLVEKVKEEHSTVTQLEQRNKRLYETKGEVFEGWLLDKNIDAHQRLVSARQSFDKYKTLAVNMAEVLDAQPPDLNVKNVNLDENDENAALQLIGVDVGSHLLAGASDAGGLWEDDEARVFYETLPELRAMLPGILYKESEQATLAPVEETLDDLQPTAAATDDAEAADVKEDKKTPSPPPPDEETAAAADEPAEAEPTVNAASSVKGAGRTKRKVLSKAEQMLADLDEYDEDDGYDDNLPDDGEQPSSVQKELMDAFERRLPNLVSRKMIDDAAVEFVTNMNTKINRKRLLRVLKEVPRSRIDLLPFYARLVRILQPVMPDLGTELVQLLTKELRGHIHFKNQMRLESKIKCCKFIGELVKFGVCPKSEALSCLQKLLFDLRHHNIDMACALLESAGQYLYRSPGSHRKTALLREQMQRKKLNAVNMEQRYQFMIDNACYQCDPPPEDSKKVVVVEVPPLQQYLEKLLYVELNRLNVEKTLKQLRKLNWDERSERDYLLRALASPQHCKFGHIQWMACVLSGLMFYHDWIGHVVVDAVCEDIRLGLEVNHPRLNQRRMAGVKYLGEMYNYRVVDSSVLFATWYSFITFGINSVGNDQLPLDPPTHLFRLRLACCLLDTCGDYFVRGSSKKKLDCYLLYLQRYYWQKKSAEGVWSSEHPFPFECAAMFSETVEKLRPKFSFAGSLEEAAVAVEEMEAKYRQQVEEVFAAVRTADYQNDVVGGDEEGEYAQQGDRHDEDEQSETDSDTLTEDESDGLDSDEEDEEDAEIHMRGGKAAVNKVGCLEDDDEMSRLFDRMLNESVASRANEQVAQADMTIPQNIALRISRQQMGGSGDEADEAMNSTPSPPPPQQANAMDSEQQQISLQPQLTNGHHGNRTMAVALMTRGKQNKPQLKTVKVAADDAMARNWSAGRQAEEREKQTIKDLTLNIAVRMEQEENEENLMALRDSLHEPGVIQPHSSHLAGRGGGRGGGGGQQPYGRGRGYQHFRTPGTLGQQIFGDNWK